MNVASSHSQLSNVPAQLSYGDYLRFRELVLERSGLYFPEKKRLDLESGLLKALTGSALGSLNGSHNLDQYYQLLRDRNHPRGRAEMERLINCLTVGETYFFRDEGQFNALATQVLPALITRKRAAAAAIGPDFQPQLRIWSTGCATGEEAYSLAILLKELLPDLDRWHILLLATDINQDSLARAREAVYSDWSFREARAKTRIPHYFKFDPATRRYTLRDDIRRMVTFAPLNLIEDEYPAIYNNTMSMDLILCRNVTIYFTEADTRRVVRGFYEALIQDGWLAVGHSEPSPSIYEAFEPRTWPNALLYQKTGHTHFWPDNLAWFQPVAIPAFSTDLTTTLPDTPDLFTSAPFRADAELKPGSHNGSSSPALPSISVSASAPPEIDDYQAAVVLLDQGQISQAVNRLQHHLSLDPDSAPAHTLLGRAYADLGQWPEAKEHCQRAVELDRLQAEAYHLLGLIYEQEAQLESAIAMLKKAIYLEPGLPLTYLNLAALYRRNGQKKDARRAYRNTIKALEKLAPAAIVPNSGGATAEYLLAATRRIIRELED